jgi:hypothetical protein
VTRPRGAATARWTRPFRPAGRRTNLALLCLLTGAFLTGLWAFAAGTPAPARAATGAHGVLALGLIVLVPWKSVVVRRAPAVFWASWGLLGLLVVCLVAGFVEVFAGYGLVGGVSPIQIHVGAALAAVPLFAVHLLRHRRQGPRRVDLTRRHVMRTGMFVAGSAALYGTVEGVARLVSGPAASRLPTGSHRLGAAAMPSTNWLLDRVPTLDPARHQVLVAGRAFTVADLRVRSQPVSARLDCTSGWYADATWSGISLHALLDGTDLGSAVSLEVVSVTGYRRRFPLSEASSLWLATDLEGQPLRTGSGAPVRLIAPHRRGFWWVKWVGEVRLSERPAYAQSPFPLQ